MTNKYQLLADLENLKKNGGISEEEYQREREKIMNADAFTNTSAKEDLLGMTENTYLMLMHLSQFAGIITAGLGFIIPIVMWVINKDKNQNINMHGKNILNFMISWIIYYVASTILIFTIILSIIGIPALVVLGILQIIFIISGAIKANSGEYWKYPMTISFL